MLFNGLSLSTRVYIKLVSTLGSIETSHVDVGLVADDVRAVQDGDRAVLLLPDFSLSEHVVEDILGILVVACFFLCGFELLLKLLDLVFSLVLDDLRELLDLQLLLHLGLRSATLGTCLEEVSTASIRRCTWR